MADFVALPLKDGGEIVFKCSAPDPEANRVDSGPINAGREGNRGDVVVERTRQSFSAALAGLTALSEETRATLSRVSPDEVSIEFGLEVEAGAGVVLASVSSTCQMTVAVTWKSERRRPDGEGN